MKQYARTWIIPALILTASNAHAFCGPYVGAAVGGSFSSGRTNTTTNLLVDYTTFRNAINHTIQHGQRKNTLIGSLYTGYAHSWEDVYLGVEGFLNTAGYRVQSKHSFAATTDNVLNRDRLEIVNFLNTSLNNTTLIRTRLSPTEPGIDLRPGFFLTPCTLLYGRVGVTYNKLSVHASRNTSIRTTTVIEQQPPNIFEEDESKSFSKYKKVGGLRLGLGLEQKLCDHLSIRADYVNTHYRSIKVSTPQEIETYTNANGDTTLYKANIVTKVSSVFKNAVLLGMSYYW